MRNWIKLLPLVPALLLAGCTGTLTNLTPHRQERHADGLYPVAVAFESRQQSLRWDSLKPYVKVGNDFFPMRPMPLMTNRWETLLSVPPGVNTVQYRFKFDWQYNAIPDPRNDSLLSGVQTMHIVDK